MTIRILQLVHHVDSISKDLTLEIAKAFIGQSAFEFCYGVLGDSPEQLEPLPLPSGNIEGFALSEQDVGTYSRHAKNTLRDFIREQQIDVVITHRYKPARLLSKIASELRCAKFIAVWHGPGEFDRFTRRCVARTALVKRWSHVGVSNAVSADLQRSLSPRSSISTIYNMVDADRIKREAVSRENAREILGVPRSGLLIGTVGRTVVKKGHSYLLESFVELLKHYPDAHLVIVGGGVLEDDLRAQCSVLGIESRVRVSGSIEDANRLMLAFDIFVMPSIVEGLGLAVLEAMALGLPVLGSDAGGIPEALGPSGLVFESGSPDAISTAVLDFLASSDDAQSAYCEYLERRVYELFSVPRYHEEYRELVIQSVKSKTGYLN